MKTVYNFQMHATDKFLYLFVYDSLAPYLEIVPNIMHQITNFQL